MARPQSPDYDKRREAILAAAAQLYAKKGFPGASVAELAKACRTSKSLIYHYFPSKDDILYAVMAEHLDALTEAAETACASGSADDKLRDADRGLHAALCERAEPSQGAAERAGQAPAGAPRRRRRQAAADHRGGRIGHRRNRLGRRTRG